MQPDMKAVFRTLGQSAVYTPSVGAPVACRAIPVGGGQVFTVGRVQFNAERPLFHVRRSEVTPAAGGVLTVDGTTHAVQAVEPVEGDPRGLLWQVVAAWGVPLQWTSPGSGGGPQYDPPDPTLTYTARAASVGATVLTIVASGWTSGYVRDGDGITVAGETHTVTSDVPLSLDGQAWVFANVPITPGLSASLSGGETVVFVPTDDSNTRAVRAAIAEYAAEEIMGGILTGDRRLVVRAGDIDPAPTTSDTVAIDGATWAVVNIEAIYQGSDPVAWVVQVRR